MIVEPGPLLAAIDSPDDLKKLNQDQLVQLSQELRQFIAITDAVKFIARIRDAHGLVRIVGNNFYGLEFDMDSMIAAEMGGKRGTSFTLSAELPDPSALAY